jgi:hypothetical protein
MRICHFQDRPGKAGFCLRLLLDDSLRDRGLVQVLRHCTKERADTCPHRGWDPDLRARSNQARSRFLGDCEACGGRHDDILALLTCHTDARLAIVLLSCPDWEPNGTDEPLLDRQTPSRLRQRAWRKAREAVLARDDWTCQDCGKDLKRYPSWYREVHHVRARVDDGSDHPRNLKTLCLECHGNYTDALAADRALAQQARTTEQGADGRSRLSDFDDDSTGRDSVL